MLPVRVSKTHVLLGLLLLGIVTTMSFFRRHELARSKVVRIIPEGMPLFAPLKARGARLNVTLMDSVTGSLHVVSVDTSGLNRAIAVGDTPWWNR